MIKFCEPIHDINYNPFDAGDDPSKFRWRATWEKDDFGGRWVVKLRAYHVVKETPKGAWIDKHSWGWDNDGVIEWMDSPYITPSWVANESGASFAKTTQKLAIDSLLYRHNRWASHILNDIVKFYEITESMARIFPEKIEAVERVLKNLASTAQKGVRV